MLTLDETSAAKLREAVARASDRADVRNAIDALYVHIQDVIDLRQPVCNASGRCCRFEEFGHRLFVTTMELAVFASKVESIQLATSGCAYQVGGLCSVHTIRPFGCRMFYCDPTAAQWQQDQYEYFHAKLRKLHEELKVPYSYVEWREGLRAVRGMPPGGGCRPARRTALGGRD
ncbi:MAG: hypothetical protein H7Z14_20290 [Anaerolineae bacterium]|nr:hypothetical protein [Phycisphaerae bacterium]